MAVDIIYGICFGGSANYLMIFLSPCYSVEQKMAARRAKVEELREKQDDLKRNKRQYSEGQRQKMAAQLVRGIPCFFD